MNIAKEAVLLDVPTNEVTELVSINEICRLCANKHEKLIAIYSGEGESNDLASKLNSYLPIKVDKNDDLPLQCCWQCASTVLAWHELVVTSIEADRRLRSSQLVSEKQLDISDDTNLADIEGTKLESQDDELIHFEEKMDTERESSSDEEGAERNCDGLKETQRFNQEYLHAVDLNTKTCISCKLSFDTKTKLKNHMSEIHNIKQMKFRRKKSQVEASFQCPECRKGFTRKFDMQRHILKVHPDCKTAYGPSTNRKNKEFLYKYKVLDEGTVYYECDLCEMKLQKPYSFMEHYNVHLDKKLHCCHLCGKKFRRNSHVNRHINQVHYSLKKFSCEYCDQTFFTKSAKVEHLNIHTNNRPYMCDLCGKSFKQSSSLYVHKMFHNKIPRFTCNICDKKFIRGGELKRHKIVHIGKRDYDCFVCKKSFSLAQDLKRHQKIHLNA